MLKLSIWHPGTADIKQLAAVLRILGCLQGRHLPDPAVKFTALVQTADRAPASPCERTGGSREPEGLPPDTAQKRYRTGWPLEWRMERERGSQCFSGPVLSFPKPPGPSPPSSRLCIKLCKAGRRERLETQTAAILSTALKPQRILI